MVLRNLTWTKESATFRYIMSLRINVHDNRTRNHRQGNGDLGIIRWGFFFGEMVLLRLACLCHMHNPIYWYCVAGFFFGTLIPLPYHQRLERTSFLGSN